MWKISYVIMWKCESFTVSAATPWIRTTYPSVSKNRFLKKSVPQPCRFFVTSYTSAVSCTVYSTWWESVTARQLGRRRISENVEVKSLHRGHDSSRMEERNQQRSGHSLLIINPIDPSMSCETYWSHDHHVGQQLQLDLLEAPRKCTIALEQKRHSGKILASELLLYCFIFLFSFV